MKTDNIKHIDKLSNQTDELWAVIDTIPGFVWSAKPDGSIEFLNQRGLDYTGFILEQINGWNWKDSKILHPDDVQNLYETWNTIVASGEPGEIQARMRRYDGEYRWFLFRVAPLLDAQGQLIAWWGVDVEINERKNVEDLLASENKILEMIAKGDSLSLILDSICLLIEKTKPETFCSIILLDADSNQLKHGAAPTLPNSFTGKINGQQASLCAGPCAMAAFKKEQIIADNILTDERWESWWRELAITHKLRSCWSTPILSSNNIVLGTFALYFTETNNPNTEYLKIIEQFTHLAAVAIERRKAEEKILQNEKEFEQIVDAISQLITVLAPNGDILYVNKPVLEYTGLSMAGIQSGGLRNSIHPDDLEKMRNDVIQTLSKGISFETEHRVRNKDGKYRWFLNRYNPLMDEQGRITRWYVTGIDIDDWKQKEEKVKNENIVLREEIDKTAGSEIIGTSKEIKNVLHLISLVSVTNSSVLILGETGTGKELVARAIHNNSIRKDKLMIKVNCAVLPSNLIESELFGHEKGSFTGATERRLGKFELANDSTIFLDEIGELPIELQVKLLRAIQEKEIERIGGKETIKVDVRIIAATNRNLQKEVQLGKFRSDLFYRLNVFPITIPPLRERREDIPVLASVFLLRSAKNTGKKVNNISKEVMESLINYSWPGNIRELEHLIERSVILSKEETIKEIHLLSSERNSRTGSDGYEIRTIDENERDHILIALKKCNGKVSGSNGAAELLGVPVSTLNSKMKKLGIMKEQLFT